jgi:hypothetical protein
MRKALRRLLLKTHPDFFSHPQDATRKVDNERSLSVINALMDGASSETVAGLTATTVQFPSPVLPITLHYRKPGTLTVRHDIVVPLWLQQGSRDGVRTKARCSNGVRTEGWCPFFFRSASGNFARGLSTTCWSKLGRLPPKQLQKRAAAATLGSGLRSLEVCAPRSSLLSFGQPFSFFFCFPYVFVFSVVSSVFLFSQFSFLLF